MAVLREATSSTAGGPPSSPLVTRRSIRAYLDKPVPDKLLEDILVAARWAPSTRNMQSTLVYALSGEPFASFKDDLRKFSEDDVPVVSDVPMSLEWTPEQLARAEELMQTRTSWCAEEYKRMGQEPPPPPANPMVAGAAIFGAPLLLVLAFDKIISAAIASFDAGLFAMAITIAAEERGLGTCIATSVVRYSELVHKHIPGLEDKNVVASIAMGYPDPELPMNRFPRSRALPKEYLTYVR